MNEDRIDEWLRKFQREHKELVHIGVDELRDLAYALHNDIPLGYEASMRLGNWLLNATLGGECEIETYHRCEHCGAFFEVMNVCPNCGNAVKR